MDGKPTDDPGIRDDSDTLPARWYATRIELGIGIGVVLFVVASAFVLIAGPALLSPCFGCDDVSVLGLPSGLLLALTAPLLAVGGLVWMIRIYRGPRDKLPPWRYRDR